MSERFGIPTTHGMVEFRSRLEARWAAFFDQLGWHWTYEPFDTAGYIPDFLIQGNRPLLVEVRPVSTRTQFEDQSPTVKVDPSEWTGDLVIFGTDPLIYWSDQTTPIAGLMGEYRETEDGGEWDWGSAEWCRCLSCQAPALVHEYQSFACRPCGHYDGNAYTGELAPSFVRNCWAKACNLTKWRAQ